MRQITDIAELRKIQIGILDEVVRICNANNIRYSLSSGTLLGAVRHKGYIPWDDDIDLYMKRSEFTKFVSCFNAQTQAPFELLSPGISKDYFYLYGKVIDKRTIMQETEIPEYQIGVNIDIFPIDFVPEDTGERKRFYKILYLIHKIRKCKKIDHCYLSSKVAYYAYRLLPISVSAIDRLLNKKFFNGTKSSKVCYLTEGLKLGPHKFFSASLFDDLADIEFEGKFYSAFRDYDSYLTNTFGNYMQLPPVEERVTHHFKAWWKD